MAVRTSLGATRARLARQLVAESLVLAAFGTAAGLVLAQWGIRAAIALVPHAIPRLAEATIDGSVLVFTIGLGAATACLFTCGPLVPLWTTGKAEALSEAGRHSTAAGVRGSLFVWPGRRSRWRSCCSPEPGCCSRASGACTPIRPAFIRIACLSSTSSCRDLATRRPRSGRRTPRAFSTRCERCLAFAPYRSPRTAIRSAC